MIISKRHFRNIIAMNNEEIKALPKSLKSSQFDMIIFLKPSFGYSAEFTKLTTDGVLHPEWHFHMHFYPPLLRSATVKIHGGL